MVSEAVGRSVGEARRMKVPQMRVIFRAALALVLLGLLGGFIWFWTSPAEVTVTGVGTRDISPAVQGVGTVEVKVVVLVASKIPGRVVSINVDQGDTVSPGQVLATLEDTESRAEIERAQATLQRSRTGVEVQKAWLRRAEASAAAAQAAVARARAVRGQARANADRWLTLERDGVVSKMDTEARVTEAATAGEEVKNAEAQLIAASEEVAALRAGLKVVEQEIAEAAASLASARARSADAVVVSPVRGFVVSRELEPGAVVNPGTPILKVADPETAWATVYVDERDARAFKVGDAADITLRSMQGRTLAGRVARIRRESDRVTEQLAVDLSFEERPAQIRLGEQVEAAIRPAPRVVTAIPASALISTREGAGAWTVEGDRLHFRKVRTGVSDRAGWVEVIEGFAPGDTVVTTPGRLADVSNEGRRVRKVSDPAAVAARAGT